ANYDNKAVGTNKTITVAYTLGGADAGNYVKPVDYTVSTGEITAILINTVNIAGVTVPVRGNTPVKTITENSQYTGTVTWSPTDSTFGASTVYTATITLTPKEGYTLIGIAENFFKVLGGTAINSPNSGVIKVVFPATSSAGTGGGGGGSSSGGGGGGGGGASGGGGGAPSGTTAGETPVTTPSIGEVTEELPDGTTANIITAEELTGLLIKPNEDGVVEIDLSNMDKDNAIKISISGEEPLNAKGEVINIVTPDGEISIDMDRLLAAGYSLGSNAEIVVSPVNGRAQIMVDGREVEFVPFENPVRIAVEYEVQGEQNSDFIVACLVDDNGNRTILPMSYFEDGKLRYPSVSSGHVEIMYNNVLFDDTSNRWMDDDVRYLAARGIIKGTGEKTFSPEANVRRADFVVMLVRMLGVDVETFDNFVDVSSDSYYAHELATARALGIVKGIGENKFNPEGEISRQDMFVMLYRAMEAYSKTPKAMDIENLVFKDYDKISDYALESLETFTKAFIVKGSDGFLNPKSLATRAEAATVLRNIMEYFTK
ncbi:MAG: S-layer homology domain-containing protein, partial [Clostridiales bacterium]|nr:S-layer homology domain-containing protein [Clostridiales bacterium]